MGLGIAALASLLALGGLFAVSQTAPRTTVYSETTNYQLDLTSYGNISAGAYTTAGNKITFAKNKLSASSGVGTLQTGGVIYNTTKISGITSVSVTLTSGSVTIFAGKTSTSSWEESRSATYFDMVGIRPNYFKIEANENTVIEKIVVKYDCTDYQAQAFPYIFYVNDQQSTATFVEVDPDYGADKQWKTTLDVFSGDILSFTDGTNGLYPDGDGDTNNVYKEGSRGYLAVKSSSKSADLYLKKYGSTYSVWLSGYGNSYCNSNLHDGTILQAWDWSISTIMTNLDDIEAAGYGAIQVSPLQARDYVYGNAWTEEWWKLYQPHGFSVNTSSSHALGTKAELADLCAAAKAKGIKIVMDVVLNHLSGSYGYLNFDGPVGTYESEIYNHPDTYRHNYGKIDWGNLNQEMLLKGAQGDYPDLCTENPHVMGRALSLLKEYLDCGVTGFRFDAAKHIETPFDGAYASSFWPYVINGTKRYSISKGYDAPYFYGEILGEAGPNRSMDYYKPYMCVGDSNNASDLRDGVNNGNIGKISGNYYSSMSPSQLVVWAETHDTFQEGTTGWMSEKNINKVYAIQASRSNATALYVARPYDGNTTMGSVGNTWWKDANVAAVNKLHKLYAGQSEYVSVNSNAFVNVRGSGVEAGAVIVNIAGTDYAQVPNMGDGTYKDLITGANYTVSGGYVSHLSFTDDICVLVPASSATYYLVGNSIFTGKTEAWTFNSGKVMTKGGGNFAYIEDIRIEEGAEVKVVKAQEGQDDIWFAINLPETYSYCEAKNGNLYFSKGGTYNIYLNTSSEYWISGTPDEEPETSSASSEPSTPTPSSSSSESDQITVTFKVSGKDAGYGNAIYLIGDFCGWDITKAIRGSYTDSGWEIEMTKETGTKISFKFVVAAWSSPTGVIAWESGSDHSHTFTTNTTVNFTWTN